MQTQTNFLHPPPKRDLQVSVVFCGGDPLPGVYAHMQAIVVWTAQLCTISPSLSH